MSDSAAASDPRPDPSWPVLLSLSAEQPSAATHLQALYQQVQLLSMELDRPPTLRLRQFDLRRWERAPALATIATAVSQVLERETTRRLPALLHQGGRLAALGGKMEDSAALFRRAAETLLIGPAKVAALQNLLVVLLDAHRHSEALAALAELAALVPGEAPLPVERFEVQTILGSGTFATVFRCLDRQSGQTVIVKALHEQPASHTFPSLFQEPQVLAAVDHPNVVRCLSHGYVDPQRQAGPYCVLEFFDGINLHEYIRRYGPLTWQQVRQVLIEALQTLATLHAQGIVHADVKPGNLLVRCDHDGWQIKLVDFGIAVRTSDAAAVLRPHERRPATPGFSAPEQVGQIAVDRLTPAADIYALARTACYCLFGRIDNSLQELDDFPSALSTVIRSSLLIRPEQRWPAEDLLAVLLRSALPAPTEVDEHATVGTVFPAEPGPASGIGTHASGPGTSHKGPLTDVALTAPPMPPPPPPPSAAPRAPQPPAPRVEGVGAGDSPRSRDLAMREFGTDLPPPMSAPFPPASAPWSYGPPPGSPVGGPLTGRGAAAVPPQPSAPGPPAKSAAPPLVSSLGNAISAIGHAIGGLFRRSDQGASDNNHRPASDAVDCTVFAPAWLDPGSTALVQVAVHLEHEAGKVALLAQEFDAAAQRRGVRRLETEVARGSRLLFQLSVPGLTVDEAEQTVVWRGEAQMLQFAVAAPADAKPTSVVGALRMSVNGVPLGQVKFTLSVRQTSSGTQPAPQQHRLARYRHVFVSYSSADRDEVLKRVQMLRQMQVEVFQDVLSLEPGQRWQRELYRRIDESDLFLLFWSTAAKTSEWVSKEVQYALDRQRKNPYELPDIVPVILEGPPIPPPPPELAHLHFNDQILSHFHQPRAAHGL